MSSLERNTGPWDERIARARELAEGTPAAADLLVFYAALAEHQKSLLNQWPGQRASASDQAPLLDSLDQESLLGAVRDLASWLPRVAPSRLSELTQAMRDLTSDEWRELLDSYRSSPHDAAERFDEATMFVLEAVLQPLAEHAASSRPETVSAASAGRFAAPLPERVSGGPRCPVCGGAPVLGVLREEGHGARRALLCGLCLTEWDYFRLVCVGCGEQKFESLPVFTADQFPHVRIEACDTCRTYLKTIDLTKDGRAVPLVDDIASLSLDLWARDRGYARLRANLIRT